MTNYMQNAARGSSSGARLNPLKMVILGATGATGLEVVRMAVERGHSMTAFVRSPDRLASFMDRIEVKRGDLLDASQLAEVIDNHDAISSSFGPRLRNELSSNLLLFCSRTPSCHQRTCWADYCFQPLLRIPLLWKGSSQRVALTGPWFDHPNSQMGLIPGSTACERDTFPHSASKSRERTWLIT